MTKFCKKCALLGIGVGLVAALGLQYCDRAQGAELRITREVPTVQGIRPAPVPHEYYDARRPIVGTRPAARIMRSPDEAGAPPNGCPVPAFRVVSGPKAERGCYGAL